MSTSTLAPFAVLAKLRTELAFAMALSIGAFLLPGLAHAHETKVGAITIEHPWMRPSPMKATTAAGFLIITNIGAEDDRLIKATSTITANVQIHDMKMEGDVMKMVELTEGIVIPAGQSVVLKPRSLHVMFQDVEAMPEPGTEVRGTLVFEKAGSVDVTYEVAGPHEGMGQ